MLVYLAGSIDNTGKIPGVIADWRQQVKDHITAWAPPGTAIFDPRAAFTRGSDSTQHINFGAIEQSTVVFVELAMPEATHVGTFIEIGYAIKCAIPVVIWQERYFKHVSLEVVKASCTDLDGALDLLITELTSGNGEMLVSLDYNAIDPGVTFKVPDRAYTGDAGIDLPVGKAWTIKPGELSYVPLAYRIAPPDGYWWRLTGRSSALFKMGLKVHEGIMDGGYRGPVFAAVENLNSQEVTLKAGSCIAQAILHKTHHIGTREVGELPGSERGVSGFGSSG